MRYLQNTATLKYNSEKCTGCGQCVEVCPHAVFAMKGKRAQMRDYNACMECGACKKNCPASAIEVREGVGCAYAIVLGKLRGTEPNCGESAGESSCCG